MKHFIEVTSSTKKYLLNVNAISYIYRGKEKTIIVLLPQGEKQSHYLLVSQTYEEIKDLILEAL